jgi:hypothetical protein
MASSDWNIVFPSKGRLTFDGGLNTKFERALIPPNESPDCLNVVFSAGAVETRGGTSKLNTTAVGSFAVDGLYTRHGNDGSETMIVFAGGSAWNLTGTSTFATIGSGQSVFTAGQRVACAEFENHLFIGNGGVSPYKWNGVAFTRHGVPAATGTVTVASITTSTGVLTGDYQYKVTYVNSALVEGDVGTATVTIALTNGQGYLTGIPAAPQSHGVSYRRIYRTAAGGTTFKRLATLNDNTTTTYVDNTADASLGATAPTDNGEPPKYNAIAVCQRRVFCLDPTNRNYVWYSNLDDPYTFASTNFLPVGDASFDLLNALWVYNNNIVVGGTGGVYMLLMPTTDPTDWSVIRLRSDYGSKSPFGAFNYSNKLMFPAFQSSKFIGFAAIDGMTIDPSASSLENAAIGSDTKSDKIESQMFSVQEAYASRISAQVFKNKAYVAVTYGDNNTTNNRVFVWDFSRSNLLRKQEGAWSPLTGISAAQFTVYNGKLYYGTADATGYVYEMEYSTPSDTGSAINSYYWTAEFSGLDGHENMQKDFRAIRLLVELSGDWMMTLGYRVDSDSGEGSTTQIDLNPGGAIWGSFNWGSTTWGGGADQKELTIYLGQVTGKRIQLKFSNQNTAGQSFKVLGANIYYNIKGRR